MTVLIVDDAVPIRERLCGLVDELPNVRSVGRCLDDSLLEVVHGLGPEVIVVDVPVHDRNGYARLASLRAAAPDSMLIVLTNHATGEFAARCAAIGIDRFLGKADDFERVVELVRARELAT